MLSRYFPMLSRIALRRLRNIENAQDAVQDALLSAHKCIGQIQGRSNLSTWLTRIVTNTALMKSRRHSCYEMLSLGQDSENDGVTFASKLTDARPNPEAIYAKTEMNETLGLALAQLSPKQRTAIQLCELDGISILEVANALGISMKTMKSRVARARQRLNLILGEVTKKRQVTEAVIGVNRAGNVCRHRRSPVHRGASISDAGLIKYKSCACI
jgi:RNA polymerase sigma-70 factor (ECF subfamily)